MDGEQIKDDPALTASDHWIRETFYVSIDKVSGGITDRFKKSKPLLEAFSLFAPSRFPRLLLQYKASRDLHKALEGFCKIYKLDSYRYIQADIQAVELLSFYKTFPKFNHVCQDEDEYDTDTASDDDDGSLQSLDGRCTQWGCEGCQRRQSTREESSEKRRASEKNKATFL